MMTGDGTDYAQLKKAAEGLRQRLLKVPGVTKVDLYGTQDERIYVEFSHAKLATLGITPQALFDAYNAVPASDALLEKNLRAILDRLTKHHGFDLYKSDPPGIEYVYRAFFTGGPDVIPDIKELDFYVSFSGIVTFPKATAWVTVEKTRVEHA